MHGNIINKINAVFHWAQLNTIPGLFNSSNYVTFSYFKF